MAISELLDKEVGHLENAKKIYLNTSEHISGIMTIRIGYANKDGD